jgi:cellulose synthase/poly-beta-1,6-N-acetylglucosamine synthase-like glycosyltransferase
MFTSCIHKNLQSGLKKSIYLFITNIHDDTNLINQNRELLLNRIEIYFTIYSTTILLSYFRCKQRKYPHDLPKASIVIPFYDEWPSVLMRTVYSIINRTPRHLLEEIILVDDNSQIGKTLSI